jgi:preprotein translocase subunit SecB
VAKQGTTDMAETPKPTNGAKPVAAPDAGAQTQVRVLSQFIKDLSFENPNIGKQVIQPGEQPNIRVEVNVNAQRMAAGVFESAIELKADCSGKGGMLYDLEIVYGALFQVENMPDQTLEPFLLVNCPALIFPFLRRLVADITREGGFPPLLLDPLDFAALYLQRRQAGADAGAAGPTAKA